MAISEYIKWLFTSMILHYCCSAYDIDREVCLETPFVFAMGEKVCKFTLEDAKALLESDTGICAQKCRVKINNLEEYSYYNHRLEYIKLKFNGMNEDFTTIATTCNYYSARTLEIICNTGFEDVDNSKDLCTTTKECEDVSKTCWLTGQIGVCICKPEYIGFGNICLKGNLKLNATCKRNEQCSMAFGSVCQNNTCVCRRGYVPLNDYECVLSDIPKDLCTLTTECEDVSKTCSLTGQIGVCICKPGYIGFGDKCLKGNLNLNDKCRQNEQCSVAFGSVCQNSTCVCSRGYAPLNDSECVLSQSGGNSQASIQDKKEDFVDVTVGSVFGGLILGIILTVFAATVFQHVRQGKAKTDERECPKVATFNNTTYENESGQPQSIHAVHRTNERKVINVPPFAHSVELPMNRNAQEATIRSMLNNDVNGDVYNHLHEKEENPDVDENYDHAHTMGQSDYSILDPGRMNKESDYSSLKKQ